MVEVALSSLFYAPPFEKVAFTLPTAWEQVWEGHPPPPPREAVPCPNAPSFGGRRSHPEQGHMSHYPGRERLAFGRWPPPWHLSPGFDTGALCAARVRGAERSGGIRGIRSCANSSARAAGVQKMNSTMTTQVIPCASFRFGDTGSVCRSIQTRAIALSPPPGGCCRRRWRSGESPRPGGPPCGGLTGHSRNGCAGPSGARASTPGPGHRLEHPSRRSLNVSRNAVPARWDHCLSKEAAGGSRISHPPALPRAALHVR